MKGLGNFFDEDNLRHKYKPGPADLIIEKGKQYACPLESHFRRTWSTRALDQKNEPPNMRKK